MGALIFIQECGRTVRDQEVDPGVGYGNFE